MADVVHDESPPAADGEDSDPASLSWHVTPATNRLLDTLSYGLVVVVGGLGLLFVVGVLGLVVLSLRDGSWGILLALGVLVVVALARPPVLAALSSSETGASFGHEGWQPSRRGLVVASVVGAVALVLAFQRSLAAVGVTVGLSVAAALVALTLTTDADIDRTGMRLEARTGPTMSLDSLSTVRARTVGSVVVYWLSYTRGAGHLRAPRVLAVPREQAPQVRAVLDRGVDAHPDADPIGAGERAIVALFAVGAVGVGPVLWLLVEPTEASGLVFTYLGLLSLVVAIPALWYAWNG